MDTSCAKENPPRVGVTVRFDSNQNGYIVAATYIEALIQAGAIPYLIPFHEKLSAKSIVQGIDGLIITGGEDIDPCFYEGGIRQNDYEYFPERDAFEIELTAQAMARDIPLLGICRGAQVLYVATGFDLIQDIATVFGDYVEHRASPWKPTKHCIEISPHSKLANIYKKASIEVVSYHHQGLLESEYSCRWNVSCRSPDGSAEAIEHQTNSWAVGVLWHPELENNCHTQRNPLIGEFVKQASLFQSDSRQDESCQTNNIERSHVFQ